MGYREDGVRLDLSAGGRGLQQTLLLLAYMCANPGAVILLDEPDAHLEVLRQREIYKLLTDAAEKSGSQVVTATHSEVLLNEAAERHTVIAFVGRPHPVESGNRQVRKGAGRDRFRPVLPRRAKRMGSLSRRLDGFGGIAGFRQASRPR